MNIFFLIILYFIRNKNGNVYYVFQPVLGYFFLHLIQIVFRQLLNHYPHKQRNLLQGSLITLTLLSQCYIIISQFFQATSVTIHRDVNILHNHPALSEKWPDSIHLCPGSTRHRKHLRAHGTTPSFMGLETDAHQMTQE